MTLTIIRDSDHNIGPGIPVTFHWDLIGPIPSGSLIVVLVETADGANQLAGQQTLLPGHDVQVIMSVPSSVSFPFGMNWAVAPGTTVRLRVYISSSGSTIDETVFTGWSWQPTTNLWYCILQELIYYFGVFGAGPSADLTDIKNAVIHGYVNTV
jgi:hypothetical protein